MRVRFVAGALPLIAGLGVVAVRRVLIVTTVDGASMEPALASGGRVLVRRTRRARRGQVVLFRVAGEAGPGVPPAGQDDLLLKRVVAVQGDTLPAGWADPDVAGLAGTRVPRGSLVVLGDNRPTSWDSRHYGYVSRDRLVGVVVRLMPARERKRRVRHALPSSFNL